MIKEVKPDAVGYHSELALVFRTEEDGGGKNALKTLDNTLVMMTVLGQVEVIEQLRGIVKADGPALLESGHQGFLGCVPMRRPQRLGRLHLLAAIHDHFQQCFIGNLRLASWLGGIAHQLLGGQAEDQVLAERDVLRTFGDGPGLVIGFEIPLCRRESADGVQELFARSVQFAIRYVF